MAAFIWTEEFVRDMLDTGDSNFARFYNTVYAAATRNGVTPEHGEAHRVAHIAAADVLNAKGSITRATKKGINGAVLLTREKLEAAATAKKTAEAAAKAALIAANPFQTR